MNNYFLKPYSLLLIVFFYFFSGQNISQNSLNTMKSSSYFLIEQEKREKRNKLLHHLFLYIGKAKREIKKLENEKKRLRGKRYKNNMYSKFLIEAAEKKRKNEKCMLNNYMNWFDKNDRIKKELYNDFCQQIHGFRIEETNDINTYYKNNQDRLGKELERLQQYMDSLNYKEKDEYYFLTDEQLLEETNRLKQAINNLRYFYKLKSYS